MSRPPKLSLAAIVADATPTRKVGGAALARRAKPPASESVRLDWPEDSPHETSLPLASAGKAGTLKERAKQMSVYLEPPVYDQLRDLAHTERTKMHALMLEALDLLFRQRGARSIEQVLGESRR